MDEVNEQKAIGKALIDLEKKLRPQLIVLDNLSTPDGINENDNSEAQKLLDWLVSFDIKDILLLLYIIQVKVGNREVHQ